MGYQAQQLVLVLSGPQDPLSPSQAGSPVPALPCSVSLSAAQRLFEQIHQDGIQGGVQVLHELHIFSRLTHSCHIFYYNIFCFYRYYVKTSGLEDKLPHHYPISQPAQHLLTQLLSLVLQTPWALALSLSVPLGFIYFLFLQICLWMNMLHFKIEFKSYIVSYMFWTETVGFYSAFVYTQDYYHCNMRKILEIWWKVNAEHMNITEYLIYSNIYKIMNIICTFQLTISSLAL